MTDMADHKRIPIRIPINDRRMAHAAMLLDDWADAIRGDWGTIDGRTCRAQLWCITNYLRGERETLTAVDIGICLKGGTPHWFGDGLNHNCSQELLGTSEVT